MATEKQRIGELGEIVVAKYCYCARCKKQKTLKRLPINFKCADLVCDFCGNLSQVKTTSKDNIKILPKKILGGAWGVQKERMDAGIYIPLYIVLMKNDKNFSIFYLSSDLQNPDMFIARKPLSKNARRSGWQGFYYDLGMVSEGAIVNIFTKEKMNKIAK